ncbi:MAG: hypothetical protein OEX00_04250 [Gammaproteobacteria bacterium]|nr:hypothetical protein [Gammaproteobacteria bacterium]
MTQEVDNTLIHCNKCGFEGKGKVSGAGAFIFMIVLLMASAYFLPLIVIALGFMVWIISQPSKRSCPSCKSSDVETLTQQQT